LVRLSQPEKAVSPINVTVLGITIDVKPMQLLKAESPILSSPCGRTMSPVFNALQPLNAFSPIFFTPAGRLSCSRTALPLNAPSPISVTVSGSTTRFRDLYMSLGPEPFQIFAKAWSGSFERLPVMTISSSFAQFSNGKSEFEGYKLSDHAKGVVTLVRLSQPEKAVSPINVTVFGITIVVRPSQLLNASAPMLSSPCGNMRSARPA